MNLLISTMNEAIYTLLKNLTILTKEDLNIYICQQITDNKEYPLQSNNYTIIQKREKGLSRSRNCLLEKAKNGITLILDDDVEFYNNCFKDIENIYLKYPQADIITFQIMTPDQEPYKEYKKEPFWHTKLSLAKVSSIEITFKIEKIKEKKITFDTLFGLGSDYTSGEEFIFLSDAFDKGLKILYYPLPIVIHPKESSGKKFSKQLFLSKGALFYRLFNSKSYFYAFAFIVKKFPLYKKNLSFFTAFQSIFHGILQYKQKGINK